MVKQAREVMTTLLTQKTQAAQRLLTSAQQIVSLIERVIYQAHSQVIKGKQVVASDKMLSLYEPLSFLSSAKVWESHMGRTGSM